MIRGTRAKPLPLLPSGPGGVCDRPLHEARSLTTHHGSIRELDERAQNECAHVVAHNAIIGCALGVRPEGQASCFPVWRPASAPFALTFDLRELPEVFQRTECLSDVAADRVCAREEDEDGPAEGVQEDQVAGKWRAAPELEENPEQPLPAAAAQFQREGFPNAVLVAAEYRR